MVYQRAISILQPQHNLAEISRESNKWVEIFDPYAAVVSLFKHVEKLASSRTTRHTAKQYRLCLYDYLEYCGAVIHRDQSDVTRINGDEFDFSRLQMHTPAQIDDYIVHSINVGRSSKTISKYLAPIRLYLDALRKQPFVGLRGDVRYMILDAKEMFEMAQQVDPPASETKSSQSAGQRGVRLNLTQVNEYLTQIDRTTLSGKRDTALFYVGIISMLRVSELARIRLCDIQPGKTVSYEVKVVGKRNNVDPVGLDTKAYELIQDYVAAYNAGLPEDDKRRITSTSALWQPLLTASNYVKPGHDASNGIGEDAIRRMFKKRTPSVVCDQIGQDGIRPHDLRRTTALGLAEQNVPLPAIQRQARHADISTTGHYIGTFPDLNKGLISNHWSFRFGPKQNELPTE